MNLDIVLPGWLRALGFCFAGLGLALRPALGADTPAGASAMPAPPSALIAPEAIVSPVAMELAAEDGGAFGQFVVAPEILTRDSGNGLIYTITSEPRVGRVGLAGGDDPADIFKNKTARSGFFAYRAPEGFTGEDSFGYTVRNEISGLEFKNTVVVSIKPPPPVMMDKVEVGAERERSVSSRGVALTTRPNRPVSTKVPSHEDFMSVSDRIGIVDTKIVYRLDDKAKPQNGTATLDPTSGQFTYSPNAGFIGEEVVKYYTVDENHTQLGAENAVTIKVEPVRVPKQIAVDRSRSREVDLVFVINNSPSMAGNQSRIAANLSRFRQLFDARDLDYRIAVLTTDFVNADPDRRSRDQEFYKEVRSVQLDKEGNPVLDSRGRPKDITKRVASNGSLVTLPVMDQPWITPKTPNPVFSELVKVGTNGDNNRTAFTSVYNFVAGYYNKQNTFLRPEATTIVVFFMDEEETRMAVWKEQRNGAPMAEWIENGKLPELLNQYNTRNPGNRQTLDSYIGYWVLRPFIIAKGNKRGKLEMHAVVSPNNVSHRRAAELTGGTVLNIESDFSAPLAALGDRIAETVAVALEPVGPGATLYQKSIRVLVDGQEVKADPENGYVYDALTHSIRFQGAAKKQAFTAKIDITYDEHL